MTATAGLAHAMAGRFYFHSEISPIGKLYKSPSSDTKEKEAEFSVVSIGPPSILNERIHTMASVNTRVKVLVNAFLNRYEPAKHYMKGPGPKTAEAEMRRRSSSQNQQSGGSFHRIVGPSGTAKVAPETRLKQQMS